jgi:hypothetical protein
MKTLTAIITTICLTSGAVAQGINYHRIGAVVGEPDPFMVVGVDLFELAPALWTEGVTYTSFDVQKVFGGIGVRKDWQQVKYTVSGGVSIVAPVGEGWNRWDNLRLAANIGVRF